MTMRYDYWPITKPEANEPEEAVLSSPAAVRSAVAAGLGSLLKPEELALLENTDPFTSVDE